jgi:hypothetical protein
VLFHAGMLTLRVMVTKGSLVEDGTSAHNPTGLYWSDSKNVLWRLRGWVAYDCVYIQAHCSIDV